MTKIESKMSQYPEIGIINPFIGTKFYLTQEMVDFFNGHILVYRDYPDAKIVKEFGEKFGIASDMAKEIEYEYVVVNRARIYKRIQNLIKDGIAETEIICSLKVDFGIDTVNAERYVYRCGMDGMDSKRGLYCGETK